MPNRFRGYSTLPRAPRFRVERRIIVPGVMNRAVRAQARSIQRRERFMVQPFWLALHRRGPRRIWVGLNHLEQRAIPKSQLRGTLPERIMYKYLTVNMHFVEGIDFDFQSSLQGGRIDTGGIVADFLFERLRIVLNPLGPSHYEYIRMRKDMEQVMALEELGYQVYMIQEDDVYDEMKFEDLMRRVFGWRQSGSGENVPDFGDSIREGNNYEELYRSVQELRWLI